MTRANTTDRNVFHDVTLRLSRSFSCTYMYVTLLIVRYSLKGPLTFLARRHFPAEEMKLRGASHESSV